MTLRRRTIEYVGRAALIPVWGLIIVLFGVLEPSTFLTAANFQTILGTQAVLVVLTLGLIVPLRAGDYDLSVASVLALSAMVVAVLNVHHHWPIGWAIIAAMLACVVVGGVNGFIVVCLGVDPFVATLGSGTIVSGIVVWISDSNTIGGISKSLVDPVIVWDVLGVPAAFFYGLAVGLMLWWWLDFTAPGRRLLFVGAGRNVAWLNGVHVGRVRWSAFVTAAAISGAAGILYAGTTGGADPSSGASFLLPAFAAAFLGATAIRPGRVNPWGSIIAIHFLATGLSGLRLAGVDSYVQQLFYGGALIIAATLSRLTARAS